MPISADDFCRLAAELAAEHGLIAREYAMRAVASFEADGEVDRARFWLALSLLLDDIVTQRVDPTHKLTIH